MPTSFLPTPNGQCVLAAELQPVMTAALSVVFHTGQGLLTWAAQHLLCLLPVT